MKFFKTVVRYEKNTSAADNADFWEKWQYPCFLGVNNENKPCWYGCTFEDLKYEKKLNNIFYFDNPTMPPENDFSQEACEARAHLRREYIDAAKTFTMSLLQLGLMPQKETVTFMGKEEVREYCYRIEGYAFERLIAKELLGDDINIESFQELSEEQFGKIQETQAPKWEVWGDLVNGNIDSSYIDFSNLTDNL